MTAEEFVALARELADRGAVRGVLDVLAQPPGRKPSPKVVELSEWFNGLGDDDRRHVEQVIELGAQQALYNLLLLLDGTLPVVVDERAQRFELYAGDGTGRSLINNSAEVELSELFKELDEP